MMPPPSPGDACLLYCDMQSPGILPVYYCRAALYRRGADILYAIYLLARMFIAAAQVKYLGSVSDGDIEPAALLVPSSVPSPQAVWPP